MRNGVSKILRDSQKIKDHVFIQDEASLKPKKWIHESKKKKIDIFPNFKLTVKISTAHIESTIGVFLYLTLILKRINKILNRTIMD